jgi:hypothetical protein
LVVAACATAAIVIAVLVDLPVPASHSAQVANAAGVITEVNSDTAQCDAAVNESLTIYADLERHALSAVEAAQAPGFLRDDSSACSLAP